jgi:hypothetical protein
MIVKSYLGVIDICINMIDSCGGETELVVPGQVFEVCKHRLRWKRHEPLTESGNNTASSLLSTNVLAWLKRMVIQRKKRTSRSTEIKFYMILFTQQ